MKRFLLYSLCAFSSVVLGKWNALFAPRANGAARRRSRWVKRFSSGAALVGAAGRALLLLTRQNEALPPFPAGSASPSGTAPVGTPGAHSLFNSGLAATPVLEGAILPFEAEALPPL